MTNKQKDNLTWKVRFYLGESKKDSDIVKLLVDEGFQKTTVRKYVKALKR